MGAGAVIESRVPALLVYLLRTDETVVHEVRIVRGGQRNRQEEYEKCGVFYLTRN